MMHGYLAFDAKGDFLVPFRTWRNTMTEEAAEQLTEQFAFNIPQRWSIAHLYQAILNEEPHLSKLSYFTTLAGYVQEKYAIKLSLFNVSGAISFDMDDGFFSGLTIEDCSDWGYEKDCGYRISSLEEDIEFEIYCEKIKVELIC